MKERTSTIIGTPHSMAPEIVKGTVYLVYWNLHL